MGVELNNKWGFIDHSGKEVVQLKYEELQGIGFSEGRAGVKLNNKWGYVDKYGKEIVPVKYEAGSYFSEGLAAVKLNNKWGYVDKYGNEIITPQYEEVNAFANGKAKVKKDGKEFYIDKPASSTVVSAPASAPNTGSQTSSVKIQESPVPMHGQVDASFIGAWRWLPDEGISTITILKLMELMNFMLAVLCVQIKDGIMMLRFIGD
jgi:hypothetical protein